MLIVSLGVFTNTVLAVEINYQDLLNDIEKTNELDESENIIDTQNNSKSLKEPKLSIPEPTTSNNLDSTVRSTLNAIKIFSILFVFTLFNFFI